MLPFDDPRSTFDDMLSWQNALTNEPLHDCIADVQFSRGFLLSDPFFLMLKHGDVMISTQPRNQVRQLRELCAAQGWTIVQEYEYHESGTRADRFAVQSDVADAAQRKFDVVLFWGWIGLAAKEFMRRIQKRLDDSGVRFHSFPEPYLDSCGMFRDAVISICGDRKARTFATPRASASRVETRAPDWHQIRQTNRTSECGLPP